MRPGEPGRLLAARHDEGTVTTVMFSPSSRDEFGDFYRVIIPYICRVRTDLYIYTWYYLVKKKHNCD